MDTYNVLLLSLCNIIFLTSSLKPRQGIALNFLLMFLVWTPTKFVIGMLPLFFMELLVILCNICRILNRSFSLKPLTRNHSCIMVNEVICYKLECDEHSATLHFYVCAYSYTLHNQLLYMVSYILYHIT